ncbi:MAG TPA: hypothetical protein VKU19_28680 [Bryobacteraceae bacterium]|nr:hypothetical protein [Bryobacteraceae bacterium]
MSTDSGDKRKVFGLPYNVGVGLLCVLGVVCLYEFYSNVLAGPNIPDAPARSVASTTTPGAIPTITPVNSDTPARKPASTVQRRSEEFNPPLHTKRPEDRIDPTKVDPTIRIDLLAKVQAVELAGGSRNLFQMGAPPPPPTQQLAGVSPIVRPVIGPRKPPDRVPDPPPPVTPVLPVQLKFYGFSIVRNDGPKVAYFMDGEDIFIAKEGELIQKRYLVKKIQATSVDMEDLQTKRSQSVPLTPPADGQS